MQLQVMATEGKKTLSGAAAVVVAVAAYLFSCFTFFLWSEIIFEIELQATVRKRKSTTRVLLEWVTRNVMQNIKRRNKANDRRKIRMKLRSCKILYAHFLVHVLSFDLFLSFTSVSFAVVFHRFVLHLLLPLLTISSPSDPSLLAHADTHTGTTASANKYQRIPLHFTRVHALHTLLLSHSSSSLCSQK